nr:hypothetical protein [Candidatus Competibacter phosphatis]
MRQREDEIPKIGIIPNLVLNRLADGLGNRLLQLSEKILLAFLVPILGGGVNADQIRFLPQRLIDLIEQRGFTDTPFSQQAHAARFVRAAQHRQNFVQDLRAPKKKPANCRVERCRSRKDFGRVELAPAGLPDSAGRGFPDGPIGP